MKKTHWSKTQDVIFYQDQLWLSGLTWNEDYTHQHTFDFRLNAISTTDMSNFYSFLVYILTSQDFSWLQKGQVNSVSRLPVIFFLGGGFLLLFLRPIVSKLHFLRNVVKSALCSFWCTPRTDWSGFIHTIVCDLGTRLDWCIVLNFCQNNFYLQEYQTLVSIDPLYTNCAFAWQLNRYTFMIHRMFWVWKKFNCLRYHSIGPITVGMIVSTINACMAGTL